MIVKGVAVMEACSSNGGMEAWSKQTEWWVTLVSGGTRRPNPLKSLDTLLHLYVQFQ